MNMYIFLIGRTIAWLLASLLCLTKLRAEIASNLALVFGLDKQKSQELSPFYIQKICRYILDILNLGHYSNSLQNFLLEKPSLQPLDTALQQNRGVILLFMHEGNWELVVSCLGRTGYPLHAIVNTHDNNFFEKLLDKHRARNGMKIININKENMYRACIRAFQKNEIAIIGADTGATDSDKHLNKHFLGRIVPVASGWATLALRTKPLVIPLFSYTPAKQTKLRIEFGGPIDPNDHKTEDTLVQTVLDFYEIRLKTNPTEWFLPMSGSEVKKSFS